MENIKPLVIVLSRNYSTGLGVIRSLGAAGYTVDLIASTKKKGSSVIASSSKYVRNSVEVLTPKIQGDAGIALIEELMKYAGTSKEKIVLFPVDDFTTSVVDANRGRLKPYFYMPEIAGESYDSIQKVMDKTVQAELAKRAGLFVPDEWLVSLRNEIVVPETVSYPCFVKPLQSISGHKTEMKACRNVDELRTHLLEMQKFYKNRDVLVQEYLSIDKEYDLSGVTIDQDVVIPAVIEKTKVAQHELGVTMCGKIQPVEVLGDTKEKIIALLKSIRYTGMFDMELNLCGDKIYFNEINFRSGGPNYSYYLNGVNLPEIFVKRITGEGHKEEEEKMYEFGKTFVYEKVAWEDYMYSYMTRKELRRCIKEADYTLLQDESDPEPGKLFYKRIRLSALKNKIKNFVRSSKSIEQKKVGSGNTKSHKKSVIVAGRNYCNILTMARALGEAGYDVEVLRLFKKAPSRMNLLAKMEPDAQSQYVKGFYRCYVNDQPKRVIRQLHKLADEKFQKLIMPVDDYTACIIDEAYQELKEFYLIPSVGDKEGEISRLMDKNEQKRLAAKYDLPMLSSVVIKSENGYFEIPEEVQYPCFIKPNISMNSTKSKMAKCNSREELKATLQKYSQKEDFEMLVETYANIKAEYSLLGVSVREKTIAPCVFKVLEGGHKERTGVTIIGEAVDASRFQKIISKCCQFINSLEYSGLFDVDLLETTDGKIYFIELNFRAGASTHLFTKTGVNLAQIYADYMMTGKTIQDVSATQSVGKKFVSEKVLLEEYVRNDISIFKARRFMSEADVCFIKDEADLQPFKYFKRYYLIAICFKFPYWIRDMKKKMCS